MEYLAQLEFFSGILSHIHICAQCGYQVNTLLVALGDANLARQNESLAAQSMGLGTCLLRNVRNDPHSASNLPVLPRYVHASVGLTIGYSAGDFSVKPRLPQQLIVSRNRYSEEHRDADITAYN